MTQRFANVEAMAQRAWDEVSIMRTLARVARAQDDLDPVAYRKCFADRVMLVATVMFGDWEPKEISADELTRMTFDRLGKMDAGHHMIFNHVIEVDGDNATCDADLYAVGVLTEGEKTSSAAAGGRYFMRLIRQAGEWAICERSVKLRYRCGDLTLAERAEARALARKVAQDAAQCAK
jgi:hypothetical protein